MGQATNFVGFYNTVWNIQTAQGFGLDILGKIVGVGRYVLLPNTDQTFGFNDGTTAQSFAGFNQAPFANYPANTNSYALSDDAYRTLVLTKAFANVAACNAPTLNRLISFLFAGRGRCYTKDLGGMQMAYVFEFQLSAVEVAILTQTGVLAHPAGVAIQIQSPLLVGIAQAVMTATGALTP